MIWGWTPDFPLYILSRCLLRFPLNKMLKWKVFTHGEWITPLQQGICVTKNFGLSLALTIHSIWFSWLLYKVSEPIYCTLYSHCCGYMRCDDLQTVMLIPTTPSPTPPPPTNDSSLVFVSLFGFTSNTQKSICVRLLTFEQTTSIYSFNG